jgi:hypothetical protein
MAYECGAAGARPFGLDEAPPKIETNARPIDPSPVIQHAPEKGKDSYEGIPGDGKVPG